MTIAAMDFVPEILARIDRSREDCGWDKPAQLYSLHAESVADNCTAVGVAEFPGFDIAMRCHGHSYHALESMSSLLEEIARLNAAGHDLPTPDLGGLFALALADEAFMVEQEQGQPAPVGDFADIPGAVEQRFVLLLVAADLSTRTLTHERATGKVTQDHEWRDGRILDAMLRLLAAALPKERS